MEHGGPRPGFISLVPPQDSYPPAMPESLELKGIGNLIVRVRIGYAPIGFIVVGINPGDDLTLQRRHDLDELLDDEINEVPPSAEFLRYTFGLETLVAAANGIYLVAHEDDFRLGFPGVFPDEFANQLFVT